MTKTTIILGAVAVVAAGTAVSKFMANRRQRVTTPANAANDNDESSVGVIDVEPEEPAIPHLDDD